MSSILASLTECIAPQLADVDALFARELQTDLRPVNTLVKHVSRFRGKMLRPCLVLLSGRAAGTLSGDHVTIATVVEMVHMATLVHDDVLDEAELRRKGATINHLACLRRMCDDKGWIKTLMDEAENERMHLMTFIEISKPTLFERFVIVAVQWVFYLFFFGLYLVSSKTAHRVVGYFEEEAVISYTHYLKEIDEGRSANVPAPAIARRYWNLPEDATLRDVVLVVRADEAHHRDVNHGFADTFLGHPQREVTPCPPHEQLEPHWKSAA